MRNHRIHAGRHSTAQVAIGLAVGGGLRGGCSPSRDVKPALLACARPGHRLRLLLMTDRTHHGDFPEEIAREEAREDDVLITAEERDNVPVSPPDSIPIATEFLDEPGEETIDERIMQEEPDPNSAYGAPVNESGLDRTPSAIDDVDDLEAEADPFDIPIPAEQAAMDIREDIREETGETPSY